MNNSNANETGHTILLGGIGGDSHSVGLTILRQSLLKNGYRVRYLGTQNRLADFFRLSSMVNAVMISCMDGHANYYMRAFPELLRQYTLNGARWYLGGNLYVVDSASEERNFIEMGFHQVFPRFVDVSTVLQILRRDLATLEPALDCPTLWELANAPSGYLSGTTALDESFTQETFESQRREVLEGWRTGRKAFDLCENAAFLKEQPSFASVQEAVNAGRLPMLIQPRSGVPELSEQIKLFKAFKSVGVRVLSYQVDSLTRNNNYAGADEAIRASRVARAPMLNGFPVINHGVEGLRRIISEVKTPLQTRHSARDPRLLAEISYAGGVTSFEGGAISYNIPYYKDYPLDESIRMWQYVDRLTALYQERFGIKLDREFFGTLTATLIPPSLAIVVNILEALLAARQGVKCVSLGYAEQGNRIQDVAAIRLLKQLSTEVLHNLGYREIQINTVFHQYMAAFPDDPQRAEHLIYQSAVTAALSGATRAIIKTMVEAIKIPALEDNLHGLSLVMRGTADAAGQSPDEAGVRAECDIIEREVHAILDSVIACGHGNITEGIVEGFRRGFIDIPFSPSLYNRGEVATARDVDGAVRYLSLGQLQFDRELREFHDFKMSERRRAEGLHSSAEDYLLVEQDVLRIARNQYECWPLAK